MRAPETIQPYSLTRLEEIETQTSRVTPLRIDIPELNLHRQIVVQYVDFREGIRSPIERVVKFSTRGESVVETKNLRLATPASFRAGGYEPGISDDLDAALHADMAPYVEDHVRRNGGFVPRNAISVSVKFAATDEPWIYCTSIASDLSYFSGSLNTIKREFIDSKGKDPVITEIRNPVKFAEQLGIDAAMSIEVGKDVQNNVGSGFLAKTLYSFLGGLQGMPPLDGVVKITHGPVVYEDRELVIRTNDDLPVSDAVRACFTKRTEFKRQCEYRFAIQFGNKALQDVVYLPASSDLLGLTSRL